MFFFTANYDKTIRQNTIEQAYLAIINEDLILAKNIFETLDSPRARWGRALVGILSGYLEFYPTYFEIRNFLEIDLDLLIKNNKIDYVELVLGSLEILSSINQEIYKFTARVLYENKLYKAAREYLDKSKKIFYNDPELHFIYAKYYLKIREYEQADSHIRECLNVLPDYYPAMNLYREISRYLA